MKKFTLFIHLALTAFAMTGVAVRTGHAQECGTADYVKYLEARYPELAEQRARAKEATEAGQGKVAVTGVITIPVVVHVVFNGAAQNVTDEQIYEQLAVLNENYRELNADDSIVPMAFEPLIADIEIQFCLASRDPDGNATTGITRTATSHAPFVVPATTADNDDVKHAGGGGADAWDAANYLNIWVCDIAGGVRGYSPYPGTSPADQDGVVIDFNNFGVVESARGRTVPHEIGHWLNLIHIWGDDESSMNPCAGTDDVADTPNQEDQNGGCPTFPSTSCSNGPNGDLFYNHMDYSDHTCRVMFTQGQRDRMRAQFMPGGLRASLLNSDGCDGACPKARFLTVDFSGQNTDIAASDAIIAWNQIDGGSDITYRAGDSIRLKPGFHAHYNNTFRAYINGCVAPAAAEPEDAAMRDANPETLHAPDCMPNPFGDALQVRFDLLEKATVSVVLFDALGRPVDTGYQTINLDAGPQALSLHTSQLPPGVYYLELRTPWQQYARQLLHYGL